jgi:hypothetical protein
LFKGWRKKMKSRGSWYIVFILLIVLMLPLRSLSQSERRIALVIGNGAYKSAPLRNPVNDAKDIGDALTNLGFTVIIKTNVDQRIMEETIREFGKKLRSGGVGLFYFAGHGLQVDGRNYLLPIGADIESEGDVKYEAVDTGRVIAQMEEAENGLNIVILDACRDNPFARNFRSREKGLAKMDAPEGSILAYATAPGSVAAEGTGRNGLYTSKLLKHITTPGLPVELFFKKVRKDVRIASGKKQVPWTESSLVGDFYFVSERGIAIVKRPGEKRPPYKNVVERDGQFILYANKVVYDKNMGLEWIVGPDRHTNWYDAKRWVESLDVEGGGWRMPTRGELKTLYKRRAGTRNMTPLLKTTGWRVWTGEDWDSESAWLFLFDYGSAEWFPRGTDYKKRGFAVRSRKRP